jgi:hypothetical protein
LVNRSCGIIRGFPELVGCRAKPALFRGVVWACVNGPRCQLIHSPADYLRVSRFKFLIFRYYRYNFRESPREFVWHSLFFGAGVLDAHVIGPF